MSTRIEGYNTFSQFNTCNFILESSLKRTIDSVQLTFGSFVEGDSGTIKTDLRNHFFNIRKFFYNHHKDGYYKKRFIFLDGGSEFLMKNGKGLCFNQAFFYLEETYEKEFVYDYFITLFPLIDEIHAKNKTINFTRYNHAKVKS